MEKNNVMERVILDMIKLLRVVDSLSGFIFYLE